MHEGLGAQDAGLRARFKGSFMGSHKGFWGGTLG